MTELHVIVLIEQLEEILKKNVSYSQRDKEVSHFHKTRMLNNEKVDIYMCIYVYVMYIIVEIIFNK